MLVEIGKLVRDGLFIAFAIVALSYRQGLSPCSGLLSNCKQRVRNISLPLSATLTRAATCRLRREWTEAAMAAFSYFGRL